MTTPIVTGDPQILGVNNKVQSLVGPLGQGSQITIVNFDLTGKLYVGYSPSITAGGPDTIVIPPLGSAVIDASRRTFIVSNTAALISGQLIPGAAQWSASPADIATQISLAGIPAIDVPTLLNITALQNIGAGGTFTTGHIPVSKFQSWYATMFSLANPTGLGTNPTVQFEMRWSVASDNYDPLITHDWTVATTPNNLLYNYRNDCEGPVFGDTLDIIWTNNDSQSTTVTLGIFGSYRSRVRPKLVGRNHWIVATGAPDSSRGLGTDGILDIFNPTVPIAPGNTTAVDLMNLIDGPVSVGGFIQFAAAGAANVDIIINPQYPIGGAGIVVPVRATAVIGEPIALAPATVVLPRRVCSIALRNESGSASNITSATIFVTTQQQPE